MSDPSHVDTGAEVAGTEADKINTGALGTLVTVGLLAMISITAAVTALVRHDIEIEETAKAADESKVVTDLKSAQRSTLNGPASYVDRGKGLVSLPIDLAKGLVVGELERDPNSATPPVPVKADAGASVTDAAVDGSAAAGTLTAPAASGEPAGANKPAPTGKTEEPKPAPVTKPEPGRETVKPAPTTSAKPSPVPTPTPTAATPGAPAPGPTK